MTEMSAWARELAAEVKAAAPNAPEPTANGGDDKCSIESVTWTDGGLDRVALVEYVPGYESWWRLKSRRAWERVASRNDFIRLVAEMWP